MTDRTAPLSKFSELQKQPSDNMLADGLRELKSAWNNTDEDRVRAIWAAMEMKRQGQEKMRGDKVA